MHDEHAGAWGWDALDDHLDATFRGHDPLWYEEPGDAPGRAPLAGFGIYKLADPTPHWFIVSYGFTELGAAGERELTNGWPFELTMRLARSDSDDSLPRWAFYLLSHLARYVFSTGNGFATGDEYSFGGVLPGSSLEAVMFARDPLLPPLARRGGRAEFLQVVPVTRDELEAARSWSPGAFLDLLSERLPLYITDATRASVLGQRDAFPLVQDGVANGSSAITALPPHSSWLDATPASTH